MLEAWKDTFCRFSDDSLDPFGIMASCWKVQQAWWRHPDRLLDQWTTLSKEFVELQNLAWKRVWGRDVEDTFPAVPFDERFQEPIWTEHPYYDLLKEHYLAYTRWLEDAIEKTPDVSPKTRRKALFWVRQALNALSPSNFFWTNPHAHYMCLASGGTSLLDGWTNLASDLGERDVSMVNDEPFRVGENLANTPGQVVFRNRLLELIQYIPTTPEVHAVPIVIIAPWINKYYILDLNREKSLVRYLVSQGFTVFITSWKNPTAEMRDTTFDDYMLEGALQAIEVARDITGAPQVHAVGYCIGGTILSALMAWLNVKPKSKNGRPVAHFTLFTALVDFAAPGDIDVFIDEESIAFLERRMEARGYLDGADMTWAFRLLRSNSLIWHYLVHNYLYGEEPPQFDVLYWNTDSTRLPAAMHSFYLREFYLNNRLVEPDGLTLGKRPLDVRRIKGPLYIVGTEQDHIAPWKETFKLCQLVSGPVRYVLATSGHILGVVSPPVTPPKRRYWAGDATGHSDPEAWRASLEEKKVGSWWEDWVGWLGQRCGPLTNPPTIGSKRYPPLASAPGVYVLEK